MKDYQCETEDFYKRNANGYLSFFWQKIIGYNVTVNNGVALTSYHMDDDEYLYYKQGLQFIQGDDSFIEYTVISKIDSEFKYKWLKVYHAGSSIFEKLLLDDTQTYLYTYLTVDYGPPEEKNRIVRFLESKGKYYDSKAIGNFEGSISSVYYHKNNISFLAYK